MKSYPFHRNRSAFSLIELLVALAIIAIASVFVFSLYHKARQSTKEVQCLANLRSYGSGVLTYATDNSGFPWWDGSSTASHTAGDSALGSVRPHFESWVRPYLHRVKSERLRCPLITAQERRETKSDYTFNYGGNSALCMYYPRLQGIPVPSSRVVLAAETLDIAGFHDSVHFNMTAWGISEAHALRGGTEFGIRPQVRRPQYHGSEKARGLNLFFLDGHISRVLPAKNDWREGPTLGNATNGGYFYDRNQFREMKENPNVY